MCLKLKNKHLKIFRLKKLYFLGYENLLKSIKAAAGDYFPIHDLPLFLKRIFIVFLLHCYRIVCQRFVFRFMIWENDASLKQSPMATL